MSTVPEQSLSQEELGALTATDLLQFGKTELHSVTRAVSAQVPHPDRPDKKWRKCLDRSERIAERCHINTVRKNVRRLLAIAKLPSAPNGTVLQRTPRSARRFNAPSVPRANGTLRGGLNFDGPLIPDEVADAVAPPAERSLEDLFTSLGYDL